MSDRVTFPFLPCTPLDILNGIKSTKFPVVHELCALQMHVRRMNDISSSGYFSDKIKWTTDEIIRSLGLSLKPLGYDDEGVVFWNFPGTSLLFLSCSYITSVKCDDRTQKISSVASSFLPNAFLSYKSSPTVWHVVSDFKTFKSLVGKLGLSSNEISLKYELLRLYRSWSETIDFNVVLQDSALSAHFMAKYCKYDEVLCQNTL